MDLLTPTIEDDTSGFLLKGRWTIEYISSVEEAVQKLSSQSPPPQFLDGRELEIMDMTAAWLLHKKINEYRNLGIVLELRNLDTGHFQIFDALPKTTSPEPLHENDLIDHLARLGRSVVSLRIDTISSLDFLGRSFLALLHGLLHPRQLRIRSIAHHLYATGVQAIPIVALIALLISIVLAYQGATQLQRFGAQIYTIDLVAISVLREMGVLLTSIIVAGRSGSAFAAEIGFMKSNEEVDALNTMGLDPYAILVVPRFLALIIGLPLLTLLADLTGLAGAALLSVATLDVSLLQYLERVKDTVQMHTFWVGIAKAPVFAAIIALIGTYRGMQATGSSESVGRLTTQAVVQSIFLVIAADALFSIIFSKLGF
jgi:phospholipid/cholesterol/gamma-HCH transport system permease protein